MEPQVSFVVPVYNKAQYLEDLFASLSDQVPGSAEWVFVDDCSTDVSAAVLKRIRDGLDDALRSRFLILTTGRNGGPAAATNKGVATASGRYIHFVDADDRLPRNATRVMIAAAEKENAELVYGGYDVLSNRGRSTTSENASYKVFHEPLPDMLRGKILGTRFLALRDAVLRSGGADESIFIQDCSLPWRIAAVSRRMVSLDAPVLEYRRTEGQLSANRAQELHDFIGSSLAILNEHPELPGDIVRIVHRRCLERLLRYGMQSWLPGRWLRYLLLSLKANVGLLRASEAHAALLAGRRMIANAGNVRKGSGRPAETG